MTAACVRSMFGKTSLLYSVYLSLRLHARLSCVRFTTVPFKVDVVWQSASDRR